MVNRLATFPKFSTVTPYVGLHGFILSWTPWFNLLHTHMHFYSDSFFSPLYTTWLFYFSNCFKHTVLNSNVLFCNCLFALPFNRLSVCISLDAASDTQVIRIYSINSFLASLLKRIMSPKKSPTHILSQ